MSESTRPPVSNQLLWYTLQTFSNNEAKVKRNIERSMQQDDSIREAIEQVLMPERTVKETRNRKEKQTKQKLYPSYLFIRARLGNADGELDEYVWSFLRQLDGVMGLIGGDNPVPLKDAEIRSILDQIVENENKVLPKVTFAIGERVKITDGPMMNLSGVVDSADVNHGKLQVSVDIFGRPTPVELEFWQVERDDRN
ncbi:MAG: transcription termination/antitermination protein NusG [Opitutales bacterium]|jgi:transcriptional antiterminator NusG